MAGIISKTRDAGQVRRRGATRSTVAAVPRRRRDLTGEVLGSDALALGVVRHCIPGDGIGSTSTGSSSTNDSPRKIALIVS